MPLAVSAAGRPTLQACASGLRRTAGEPRRRHACPVMAVAADGDPQQTLGPVGQEAQRSPVTPRPSVFYLADVSRGKLLLDAVDGTDFLITLVQVTGAILFWRGIWVAWDVLCGFSAASQAAAVLLGLIIMFSMRVARAWRQQEAGAPLKDDDF